jgi:hypothetical protein
MAKRTPKAQPAPEGGEGVIDPGDLAALMGGDGAADGSGSGDGAAPPADPPAPELVTVRLGDGRTIQVSPEVADALESERSRFHTERGRLTRELEEARRPARPAPTREEDEGPELPDPRLALDDIAGWQRKLVEYQNYRQLAAEKRIRDEVRKETEARTAKTEHERLREAFLERIGRQHTHLDGERDLLMGAMVRVARAHPDDPLPYDEPRTMKLVVEDANATLLRLAERSRAIDPAPKPPKLEQQGRTGGGAASTITKVATTPLSIADLKRERRDKRRRAAAGA